LAPNDFAGRAEVAAEAQRIAGELRGLGQDGGQTGFFGASSLQRIGGASEEFFRVRPDEKQEQKRGNEILRKILGALEKGEPLVLKGSQ
jgi:hypothetical protein